VVLPWVTDSVDAEGFSVKLPGDTPATVRVKVVVSVSVPEVPVIVTVAVPTVAVLLAANVSTLELVEDAGLNDAVTPLGRPVAAKDTLPVNPPVPVTVMVSVALLPWVTDSGDAEGASVKLGVAAEGAPLVQVTPLSVNAAGGELVTPFQVPLNPN